MIEEQTVIGSSFKPSSEYFSGGKEYRTKEREGMLSYGISYLDDCLNGISKRDLILLGGRTGSGKTEIATIIAQHNAISGKRVHMFALEAAEREIESRITFRFLSEHYNKLHTYNKKYLNYKDWINGKLDDVLGPMEEDADMLCAGIYKNLNLRYRGHNFTIEDLEKELLFIQHETDLIILDHLHYIDLNDDNENKAMKSLVQRLRSIALEIGKPIIALAHLRKADKKTQGILPDLEDFHGSSDITKIATSCILMAPAYEALTSDKAIWGTYIRVAKCREDGSRTRYLGQIFFNARNNSYEPGYRVGLYKSSMTEFTEVDHDKKPHWAHL